MFWPWTMELRLSQRKCSPRWNNFSSSIIWQFLIYSNILNISNIFKYFKNISNISCVQMFWSWAMELRLFQMIISPRWSKKLSLKNQTVILSKSRRSPKNEVKLFDWWLAETSGYMSLICTFMNNVVCSNFTLPMQCGQI